MEIYVDFTINGKKYRMAIVRGIFKLKHVALCRVTGQLTDEVLPIDKVKTSTLKELIEYWFIVLRLKVRKKRRNKNRKSLNCKS